MNKQLINEIILGVVLAFLIAAGAYQLGKHSVVIEVDKTKQVDKDIHSKTVKVKTKLPSGEETTTTTIVKDTSIESSEAVHTEVKPTPKTNVSLLVGAETKLPIVPLYGISVTREVLGPITVGAFGMSNSTVGVSLGVDF